MQNDKLTFEVCGKSLPLFASIREVARLGIMPEYSLRLREAQGKLPGVYTGRNLHINVRQFLAMLDEESAQNVQASQNARG